MRVCDRCRQPPRKKRIPTDGSGWNFTTEETQLETVQITLRVDKSSGFSTVAESPKQELCDNCLEGLKKLTKREPSQVLDEDKYYHNLSYESRRNG